MGKIIVIEGSDGAGKTTQLGLLCEALENMGREYRRLEFPCYSLETSALVRMYLDGKFGKSADSVNAYAASSFFAVDRIGSYLSDWKKDYESDKILLSGRYTTSNAIHQGAKLPESEREAFFSWLFDYEYNLLKLPKPDIVIFLDLLPEIAEKNITSRGEKTDIHEKDREYLRRCYECASEAARALGWVTISCAEEGEMLSRERIHEKVMASVKPVISQKGE